MNKLSFSLAISRFPNYLYINQYPVSTITAYTTDLKLFKQFMQEHLNNKIRYVEDFTKIELLQYQEYLIALVDIKVFSLNTAYRKYNALKTFFKFINSQYNVPNILENDKWGNSKKKHKNDFYLVLEQEHIEQLLNAISKSTDKNKYRDLAIFALLISTGCRREDVLNLEWSDINYARNELLLFHNKTGTGKVVQLPTLMKKAFIKYQKSSDYHPTNPFAITSRQLNQLSKSAYTEVINKWIDLSGIQKYYSKKITGHCFRHTFVTNCIRSKIAQEKIMDYTGHIDAKTFSHYCHLVSSDHDEIANMYDIAL